jgi:hypothetical protein
VFIDGWPISSFATGFAGMKLSSATYPVKSNLPATAW